MKDRHSRQVWMATLAKASLPTLEQRFSQLENLPRYEFLRAPEIGLTMVQGRAGGSGQPFCLGEMTLTRCVVKLQAATDTGMIAGFGYVAGRSLRHAELAAVCDALLQHDDWHDVVQTAVMAPLRVAAEQQKQRQQRQAEATRVHFFTLVRGE